MGKVTALEMDTITDGSGHQMTGMAVSVCLTPAAPVPLPIPYPTMGSVSEGITDPCMRTKIEGNKILTVGGCMSVCHGNEPGTLKEVVSLNTAGPCFPWLGAPTVFIELGMAGITGSMGQMNKAITVGAGASASGAGGGGGGGGGAGGDAGGPGAGNPTGGSNAGGGGGGSSSGASPPSPPASPTAEGQAKVGHPVDVITGVMFTPPTVDIDLRGPLPLQWVRQYRTSSVRRTCGLGWGWSHAFAWSAEEDASGFVVLDSEGSPIRFPPVENGEIAYAPFGRSLERRGAELVLATQDGVERVLRRAGPRRYRLDVVRDRSGNATELEWDAGEIVALTDCVGRRVERERTGSTTLFRIVVTDAEGREHRRLAVAYELDGRGDLVKVVDAGGVTIEYRYDDEHFLVEERLPDGMVYHFRYADGAEGARRCVETWGDLPGRDVLAEIGGLSTSASGVKGVLHMRLDYDERRRASTVTDATGGVHRYRGNALGLVEEYVDPLGRTTRLAYDGNGHLVSVIDAMGHADRTTYDAMGRPLTATDALGRILRFRRDGKGNAIEHVDYAGAAWKMRHDGAGKIVARTDPSGATTKCAYDARGLATETSGPGGTEKTQFDAHGNLVERTSVRGEVWRYTWDLLGLPVRLETPAGSAYDLSYDSRGDIVAVEGPHGRTTERLFDARRRVTMERHPSGGVTRSRFVGEVLVERLLPDGARLAWGYDAMLRTRWIENAAGERHTFEYDAAGQLVRELTFAGIERRYEYDALGRCTAKIGADGRALRLVLDALGQTARREHAGGGTVSLDRDERGFVVRASNGVVDVLLTRDRAGRVVREEQRAGGWSFTVQHELDALGYEAGTRYSTGWSVSRRRSAGGVLEQLRVQREDGSIEEALTFEYGAEDIVRREGRRDGIATARDRLGRPSRIRVIGADGEPIRVRAFEWSKQPGVASIADSRYGTRTYELDVMGRPLRASGLGVEESYGYSPQGTPLPHRDGAGSVGRGGRKRVTASAQFTWDAEGRLTRRQGDGPHSSWTYAYDDENHMTEALRDDGFGVRFLYDAFGRRVALIRTDGTSTWFGWSGDALVEERSSTGGVDRRVFRDDGITPLLDTSSDAGWRLVATDAVSTPWLYLGRDGSTASLELGPLGEDVRAEGGVGLLRLAGQRADVETGLRYHRHRYYAPELGTFVTPDPLGLYGSTCDVGFVPNTTEYLDPLGLIIVVGYTRNDDHPVDGKGETQRAAEARAAATGQTVVRADQLQSPSNPGGISLAGESHVEIIGHGPPDGGQVTFQNGQKNWVNGQQLGGILNQAGLQPGTEVVVVACNAATTPAAKPKQSVIAGVNQATGCPTSGPSGIAYTRPYTQQYCGVCPPTPGAPGSIDLTDGHWAQATGPAGATPTVSTVATPSTQHADSWNDPSASPGRGSHGGFGNVPHQDP